MSAIDVHGVRADPFWQRLPDHVDQVGAQHALRGGAGQALDLKRIAGHIASGTLRASRPLLNRDLVSGDSNILRKLEPGYRAVTLRIGEADLGIDFIRPGQWVDVVGLAQSTQDSTQAKTILQNIKVLAVNDIVNYSDPRPRLPTSITLMVQPDQAARLLGARARGALGITLRHPFDTSIEELP